MNLKLRRTFILHRIWNSISCLFFKKVISTSVKTLSWNWFSLTSALHGKYICMMRIFEMRKCKHLPIDSWSSHFLKKRHLATKYWTNLSNLTLPPLHVPEIKIIIKSSTLQELLSSKKILWASGQQFTRPVQPPLKNGPQ